MVSTECVKNVLFRHLIKCRCHVDHVQCGHMVSVALHDYLSCRFDIYCDLFFIEDCNTFVVTEGAD